MLTELSENWHMTGTPFLLHTQEPGKAGRKPTRWMAGFSQPKHHFLLKRRCAYYMVVEPAAVAA